MLNNILNNMCIITMYVIVKIFEHYLSCYLLISFILKLFWKKLKSVAVLFVTEKSFNNKNKKFEVLIIFFFTWESLLLKNCNGIFDNILEKINDFLSRAW